MIKVSWLTYLLIGSVSLLVCALEDKGRWGLLKEAVQYRTSKVDAGRCSFVSNGVTWWKYKRPEQFFAGGDRRGRRRGLSMNVDSGATERYTWKEGNKELNIKVRMPAWAKGKSVLLDLTKTSIRLALREDLDKPIIQGDLRGAVRLDGCYWTMEEVDDGGKLLYLTLEKMPEVTGSGPWMGVVQGDKMIETNYAEEEKAAQLAAEIRKSSVEDSFEDPDPSKPRHTGEVNESGFCTDILAVQGDNSGMIARQVPTDGNALFSAVCAVVEYLETGQHPPATAEYLGPKANALRKDVVGFLTDAYQADTQLAVNGKDMPVKQLVGIMATQSGMRNGNEYLQAIRADSMWGAGPEIVALAHVLKRPIRVYELASTGLRFGVRSIGDFGLPTYSTADPICLLSTYAKFPLLDPGSQVDSGNHYMPLFPQAAVP